MAGFDHRLLRDTITTTAASVAWNERTPVLVAKAIQASEGELTAHGALAVTTGVYTGRSVKDKFIVEDDLTRDHVWWQNSSPMGGDSFDRLLADVVTALAGRHILGQDLVAGAEPRYAMPVTVFTESAWHALFIRNLLIREPLIDAEGPPATIIHLPSFTADPARHGTRTGTVIALDMSRNLVIIAGTAYAGEIKKSVFSLFNFHAPFMDVLPMHCSANIGPEGDVALFFGLSGTGKTTLSNDPNRPLIGDDEHGWTRDGVFNLEGGCYAKTVNLSATAEPEIHAATRSFGTVLENLLLDKDKHPLYDDISLTENTRAAYSLETLPQVAEGSTGGVPRTVVFLTADAFGVLPPIAKLTPEQAVYHFLSGYTAKVAGTERGITEPLATFSACFGAPFMPLHPTVYGRMLRERLEDSAATVYLLNTGWTGGAYGTGRRIDIAATRRLLNAALAGELERQPMRTDPVFGFAVPTGVTGIDESLLDPRRCWPDPDAYDRAAQRLLSMFSENYRQFEGDALSRQAAAE